MCLITLAYKAHPKYKFILAANRDEFYARPTAVVDWWEDHNEILGGRDLQALGTWMAFHKNGRFAAVTNYRDIKNIKPEAQSRGDLPVNFLLSDQSPESYAEEVNQAGRNYNGFNLLVLEQGLVHVSNYEKKVNTLGPGIYGLSNALLDTPWPKVTRAKRRFSEVIQTNFTLEDLIAMMQDDTTAQDNQLPETGLDYEREKALSAMCIRTPDYGTCCSTAITIDHDGHVDFMEKSYPVGNRSEGTVSFNFKIHEKV
ncbi:NRDE family protein [Ekhidna sp. To15]|uniref:NRDE family protein n=1 Tax=Ekhidna sp. To15 TaxID=3395267 RepID=UPI003F5213C5